MSIINLPASVLGLSTARLLPRRGMPGGTTGQVTTTSPRNATVAASSGLALAYNVARQGSSWVNDGTIGIYLGLGVAAVVGKDIYLGPGGGSWDGQIGPLVFIGNVYAIAISGSSNNLCVTEV